MTREEMRRRYNQLMVLGPSSATWPGKVVEAEQEIEFHNRSLRAVTEEEIDAGETWDRPRRLVVPRGWMVVCSRAVLAVEAERMFLLEQIEGQREAIQYLTERLKRLEG